MKKILTLIFILSLSSCYVYDSSIANNYEDDHYHWRYNYYWYPNTFYYRPYSRTIVIVPKPKQESRPRIENPSPRPFNPQSRERQAPIRTFPRRD